MEEAAVVSWRRDEAGLCSRHDVVARQSRQHIVVDGRDNALCGARVLWLYLNGGDGTRCERCYGVAHGRGLVDQYGQAF